MEEALIRYMHFLGIIIIASALIGEYLLISKEMNVKLFKKVVLVDAIYGIGAVITLTGGLLLWLYIGKPKEFYSTNMLFHIKISLFVTVGILSAFPTYYFLRNRKTLSEKIIIPSYIINIIRLEIVILVVLLLLGVLIAKGIGNN